METRELILLKKAREIANRSSVRYGGMSFVEALVTMGRWCDANPEQVNNKENDKQATQYGRTIS